jgi:ABC-2 type transport system ATP-binding protein
MQPPLVNDYPFERTASAAAPEHFTPFKVTARKEDRILLSDPGDILYATSRESKTYLRTTSKEAVTNFTLQDLASCLAGRGFFKAHRAYLVNLQHIKAVIQYSRSSSMLQLDDQQESMIPLSKQSEKELQERLGYSFTLKRLVHSYQFQQLTQARPLPVHQDAVAI